jgi:iron complex outermembrane receptor protein
MFCPGPPITTQVPINRARVPSILLLMFGAFATTAGAQQAPEWTRDLEDLMSVEISSAGRREQRPADTAAASFVLTSEDIRRSGLTSVPDLLRLVPGVHVAQIDADNWAVTARGFNSRTANKLLVMVNGRSIYTSLFSGVSWDMIPMPVEDIERIEIVRGPGASVWGANAVNGVINIISKTAPDAGETAVHVSAGSTDQQAMTFQHGGSIGSGAGYRLFGTIARRDAFPEPGAPALGHANRNAAGASFQRATSKTDRFYVDMVGSRRDSATPLVLLQRISTAFAGDQVVPTSGWNWAATSRWTHQLAHTGTFVAEASIAREGRDDVILFSKNSVFNAGMQHLVGRRGRHDLTWGATYRFTHDRTRGEINLEFTPPSHSDHLLSTSFQDQITLTNRIALTVGSRLEYHTYVGWSLQPTARLQWRLSPSTSVWGAVSSANRTPSRYDRALRLNAGGFASPGGIPVTLAFEGNPQYGTEHMTASEGGYRFSLAGVQLDVAAYYNRYSGLGAYQLQTPYLDLLHGPPHLVLAERLQNAIRATTAGTEISAAMTPATWLKLSAAYTLFALDFTEPPSGLPPELQVLSTATDVTGMQVIARVVANNVPRHQGHVRASTTLPNKVELDATVFGVARLVDLAVPGYARVDLGVSWPIGSLRLAAAGQNLLTGRHLEFDSRAVGRDLALIPRQVRGTVTWRF